MKLKKQQMMIIGVIIIALILVVSLVVILNPGTGDGSNNGTSNGDGTNGNGDGTSGDGDGDGDNGDGDNGDSNDTGDSSQLTGNWVDLSNNIGIEEYVPDFSDVFFVSDDEGWITSSSHAEIYHTTDGGLTFEIQTTQYTCYAIHMLNENEGYAGGASGFVYRTTDGGENWDFHGTTVATFTDISFPPTGNTGYCCGKNGNIWSIDSNGVTKMTSGVPDTLYSLSFPINSNEGWLCGGSIIRHYTNGAWVGDQFRPSGGYNAIYFVDSQNGWAVGDNGIIVHTTDGHNWVEQTNPDPDSRTLSCVFFLNTNEGWAIGGRGTIIHTTNGGTTWYVEGAGITSHSLTGVHFTSSTNGYVVGNGKTIFKFVGDE